VPVVRGKGSVMQDNLTSDHRDEKGLSFSSSGAEKRHKWSHGDLEDSICVHCGAERGSVNGNLVYRPKGGTWSYGYVVCRR
jgi:hypothetical protein